MNNNSSKNSFSDVKVPSNTLAKGLYILETVSRLSEGKSPTLAQITKASGMNRSTVYRYLKTLLMIGWLRRNEDSYRYKVGFKALQLASTALEEIDIRNVGHSILAKIVSEEGITAHLSVLSGELIVYIDKVEPEGPIIMKSNIGTTAPAYSTAAGKAMLSTLDPEKVRSRLKGELEKLTENTITSMEDLLAHLEKVRERGYATDIEENEKGIRCVGAPIYHHDNSLAGALSLSDLSARLNHTELGCLGNKAVEFANEISLRLGSSLNNNNAGTT
jgi:DNA-binding IclR family transcriptional regulator